MHPAKHRTARSFTLLRAHWCACWQWSRRQPAPSVWIAPNGRRYRAAADTSSACSACRSGARLPTSVRCKRRRRAPHDSPPHPLRSDANAASRPFRRREERSRSNIEISRSSPMRVLLTCPHTSRLSRNNSTQ